MKKIILASGEIILNIFVVLVILVAIIGAVPMFKYGQAAAGMVMLVGYIGGVVLVTFLIYLLIDIRDKMAENNALLRYKIQNETEKS